MGDIAKAGKLVCVDSGEYSDYRVIGFFVVLRDFDHATELAAHLDAHGEQKQAYCFERDKYLAALIAKGLLMEVDYATLYLGSYGSPEDSHYTLHAAQW